MRPAPQPELRERRRYPMQVNLRKQLEKMLVAVHLAFIAFIHPTASSPPAMKSTADSSKSRSRSKSIQRTEKHREAESTSSNVLLQQVPQPFISKVQHVHADVVKSWQRARRRFGRTSSTPDQAII